MSDSKSALDWILDHVRTASIADIGPQECSNLVTAKAELSTLRARVGGLEECLAQDGAIITEHVEARREAEQETSELRATNARLAVAVKQQTDKLASVKCDLLQMLELIPVPGSQWRMNIKTMLRTIDAQAALQPAPDAPKTVDVFSLPECVFHYCPHPDKCKADRKCSSPR